MKRTLPILLIMAILAPACKGEDKPTKQSSNSDVTQLKDPELSWSEASFEAVMGGENTFPTLANPHGVGIEYSSSKEEVATISENGSISVLAPGTAMITATSIADDTYFSAKASYMLIVPSESGGGDDGSPIVFSSTGDPGSDDDICNTSFAGKIKITFSNSTAASVEGDSYGYVSIDGNKVTVNNTGSQVLVYELTGSTSNGFFKLYGTKKQAILLNGVSISNPDGAAMNNQCKKRTFVVVRGSNTLSDSESAAYTAEGEEDLKAVFFSESQLIFSGIGILNVNANNRQGKSCIATDDYVRLMDNPTLRLNAGSGAGHGLKGKDYVCLSSGSLAISTAAAMKKGISSDDHVLVTGGTHVITVSGGVAYDDEDGEYSGTAGVRADNYFGMTGGSLTIRNTGDGGKGVHAGSYDYDPTAHTLTDSYISGGTLEITTTGREVNDVSAKGIKVGWVTKDGTGDRAKVTGNAGNLLISGGRIIVNSNKCEGLEAKGDLTFSGGETYVTSEGDDAINCQGELTVNDGYIYAFSSQNDAMDSNGNTVLNGGYVFAATTKGNPEVGLDANTEGGYKLYINSGVTMVAYGGLERGYSATQSIYTMNVTSGKWNALHSGSSYLAAFMPPSNISTFIVSAPGLSSGYKAVSVSGTEKCNGVWVTDGISGGTKVTLSSYNGSGSGGGGGRPPKP